MFSQNPMQSISIRFALVLFITALLFNVVQPVFAATELALSGVDIRNTGAVEMVEGLQTVGQAERFIAETVSNRFGW